MNNLVRAARNILLAVGELPPNKKLIRAAFALQEALAEQALQKLSDFHQSIEQWPTIADLDSDVGEKPTKEELADVSVPWYDREDSTNVLAEKAEQEPIMRKTTRDEKIVRPGVYEVSVEQTEQEPFDMDDHPPHRLCECRKCMEYFTPLPDCDAFAASGKPIAEQTNTQLMEGYRIGLAEMREKCAKVAERFEPDEKCSYVEYASAAIRAIKFEGNTGFRPVSEMIAEHKQDPKKAAAIEKAKMRKAERKPVAEIIGFERTNDIRGVKRIPRIKWNVPLWEDESPLQLGNLYTRPVRTKDLTDDEICKANKTEIPDCQDLVDFARAVIAADREKNK